MPDRRLPAVAPATFWFNLIGYQALWLATMVSVARGSRWLPILMAVAFFVVQLGLSPRRSVDIRLSLIAITCGLLIDGGLASAGWLEYAAADQLLPLLPAPLWILGLWLAFSTTLCRSFGAVRGRPVLAGALGAIGGPMAYLTAGSGWAAVVVAGPYWPTLLLLALGWMVALVLLSQLAEHWSQASPPDGLHALIAGAQAKP